MLSMMDFQVVYIYNLNKCFFKLLLYAVVDNVSTFSEKFIIKLLLYFKYNYLRLLNIFLIYNFIFNLFFII